MHLGSSCLCNPYRYMFLTQITALHMAFHLIGPAGEGQLPCRPKRSAVGCHEHLALNIKLVVPRKQMFYYSRQQVHVVYGDLTSDTTEHGKCYSKFLCLALPLRLPYVADGC